MSLPSVLASSESHDAEQNLVGRMKFSTPDGKLVQFHLKLGLFASVVALGLVAIMKFRTRIVSLCGLSIGHIPFLDGVGLSNQLLLLSPGATVILRA